MKITDRHPFFLIYLLFFFYSSPGFSLVQDDLEVGEILVTESDNVLTKINEVVGNDSLDTLVFDVGTYNLNLAIKESITLKGVSTADVILQSDGVNPIIQVSEAATVTIQNFTFTDANVAIVVASSTATIQNNIFSVGSAGTAIQLDNNSNVTVQNNMFNGINTAVEVLESDLSLVIKNNIFYNLSNESGLFVRVFNSGVTYNCFDQVVPAYYEVGGNIFDTTLGLVKVDNNDFHLLDTSICKNAGDGFLDIDASQTDIGAYGGAQADQSAFPVSDITVTGVTAGSVDISWSKNEDYRISGYKVYYSRETMQQIKSVSDRGALNQKQVTSDDTTLSIVDLETDVGKPATPTLISVLPVSDRKLSVKWQKASDATNYTIYYQADGASPDSIDVGDVDVYTLDNLVNGVSYTVWLIARNEYKYYFQVVAYIESGGQTTEGLFVNADKPYSEIDKNIESDISLAQVAIPEAIVPYPALPSEGCFIATAAFGFYSHSQVQILRDFRDHYLLTNDFGTGFVSWYYHYGPYAANFINEFDILKPVVRVGLYPLILLAQASAYHLAAFWVLLGCYLLVLIVTIKIVRRWYFGRLNLC
ncbi:MAG: fibronectin type III domain-containing protein [Gammaproteobacteria bacterium]|nr:fibronectin type III domain-containing protein [Gammaproteobacteria bacterium]